MTNRESKDLAIELLKQGKTIKATWDAGGDETLCNVVVYEKDKFILSDEIDVLRAILSDKIVMLLNLPNAGENFDKGDGIIRMNKQGDIVLTYSCRKHTYGKDEVEIVPMEVDDPENLRSYLHKIEVIFSGYLYANKEEKYGEKEELFIHTVYGDPVTFEKDKMSFYENLIREILNKKVKEPNTRKNQKLSLVSLAGILTPDLTVHFKITKSYIIPKEYKNKTIVLL